MSSLSGGVQLFPNDIHDTTATRQVPVGTLGYTTEGRKYRYTLAGAVALSPGELVVAATVVANHVNMSVQAAAAVGAESISVTLGATAATADQYAGGYLTINDAAGEGISYLISGHPAADASATLTLGLVNSVTVALTTSSQGTLSRNPYDSVVISATDQADLPLGVPNVTIPLTEFGWVQTHGVCSTLADEAIAAGVAVTTGTGVTGAVEGLDAAGEVQVGVALEAGVDTEHHAVYLTID